MLIVKLTVKGSFPINKTSLCTAYNAKNKTKKQLLFKCHRLKHIETH